MRSLTKILKNKKIDYEKVLSYGFKKIYDKYIYKKIINDTFEINIEIDNDDIKSFIIDLNMDEEYILVDVSNYAGNFVGTIRQTYENIIKEVIENITTKEYYKTINSKEIIDYIKEKYDTILDYPWEDTAAVARNKKNKWYMLMMKIPANKIGIESDEEIEVINLKYQKYKVDEVIDNISIFPAYHMNKKSWITIMLDSDITKTRIKELIDNSYNLS